MFYSLHPDGEKDKSSIHASCPTTKGDKWSATKWIHVGPVGCDEPVGPCEGGTPPTILPACCPPPTGLSFRLDRLFNPAPSYSALFLEHELC